MITREQWLLVAANEMREWFKSADGATVPDTIRISCGFPSGTRSASAKSKTIGQCWNAECSADKHHEIFISPVLSDSARVLDVLLHELCHAALPTGTGHKGPFKRLAESLGLTGKMTATTATPELVERLNALIGSIGKYPHAKLNPVGAGTKKQTTRLVKIACPACDYTARTTAKWIETGLPTCCCGESFEVCE